MKIAVVAPSPVPFTRGGAERALWGIQAAINDLTHHEAEMIKLPVDERDLPAVLASYELFAGLDLSHFDRIITTKYPAWMVDHPHKTSDVPPAAGRLRHVPVPPPAADGARTRRTTCSPCCTS